MGKGNRDDMLSNLPDDILVNILDRLDVTYAVRTSILSRRWSRLSTKLSRLTISILDFLPRNGPIFEIDEVVRSNAAVVEATTSILAHRDSTRKTIHLLSMTFFLKDSDHISIGHAVAKTMATRKVEMAEFNIMTERDATQCDDDNLASYGKKFILFFDAFPDAFGGLTRLHLENLRFGESDITNVLIVCKRLKDLRLMNCDSGETTTLQVDHSQLSDLAIGDCLFAELLLNSVPKLTRLAFEGWISFHYPLSVGDAPLLEAVKLNNVALSWHKMVELSKFLCGTSVRDLKLGFKCEKIWVQPECLTKSLASVFRQLRFVNLDEIPEGYDLTWTLFILKAAPLLKELYITVWDHLCKMVTDEEKRKERLFSEEKGVEWESSASDFHHENLVTLVIFGFQSEEYMVSYIRRVMEAATNLEEVFLYHRLACRKCLDNSRKQPFKFPWTKRQRLSVKKRITDGIDSFAIIHFPTTAGLRSDHVAKKNYP
ncbi:F-box/FBD/LRR-repeat protein At2g04230 [Aegilops tauschii subsp. strangulata]|uniref:F-box domain-containing protein n=4 Tax=Triticinae TaxID=1648030 RepID=A0A453SRE7_AEGTS|nr:F-box/FBD/LRR-repeat protein At2g04230 [Aegilops tauschii subsp. strangulata]XP_044438667.1 F-box/FBD/LRR-repeat protein At2g04230-like [Triticum aestivum]